MYSRFIPANFEALTRRKSSRRKTAPWRCHLTPCVFLMQKHYRKFSTREGFLIFFLLATINVRRRKISVANQYRNTFCKYLSSIRLEYAITFASTLNQTFSKFHCVFVKYNASIYTYICVCVCVCFTHTDNRIIANCTSATCNTFMSLYNLT